MKKHCLALDLKDDPKLIAEYELHHQNTWPEVQASILESGIEEMEIYRTQNRLFMIMVTRDDFDFSRKAEMDKSNPKVQEWEHLMWSYQKALPLAKPGEKWILMEQIFKLS
ncbi:L-rhamnose mutarotase [Pedobacter sp. GR22-6]|uniref:L-rhamnose mutarotase n=1 Tax=Pedobacter sp. GR22-6 TaxID=3127957 RepID=UPI00307F4160